MVAYLLAKDADCMRANNAGLSAYSYARKHNVNPQVYTHTHTHTRTHIYMHACMHTSTCMHAYIHTSTCIRKCAQTHVNPHVHTQTCTHTHARARAHTHTHTQVTKLLRKYLRMSARSNSSVSTNTTSETRGEGGGAEQAAIAQGVEAGGSQDGGVGTAPVGAVGAVGGLASRPRGGCGGIWTFGGMGARLELRGGGRRASSASDSSAPESRSRPGPARKGRRRGRKKGAAWRLGDGRGRGWEWHYEELLRYRLLHGHSMVPQSLGTLGMWAAVQRHHAAAGSLCARRLGKLQSAGFKFDPQGHVWQRNFCQLLLYRQQHGDCNPLQSAPGSQGVLGRWVGQQRHLYQSRSLRADRVLRLSSAGFIFNKADLDWERHFGAFQRQQEWQQQVEKQKQKESAMQKESALPAWATEHPFDTDPQLLRPLPGSDAATRGEASRAMDSRLCAPNSQVVDPGDDARGALSSTSLQNPSADNITPLRLINWISYQRDLRRRGRLRADRQSRLEAAGMVWNVHDAQWSSKLERVRHCLRGCPRPVLPCGAPAVATGIESSEAGVDAVGWCGEGVGDGMPGAPREGQDRAHKRRGMWQKVQSRGLRDADLLQWLQHQQGQARRNAIRADRLQELQDLALLSGAGADERRADERLLPREAERKQGKTQAESARRRPAAAWPLLAPCPGVLGGGSGGRLNVLPAPILWR